MGGPASDNESGASEVSEAAAVRADASGTSRGDRRAARVLAALGLSCALAVVGFAAFFAFARSRAIDVEAHDRYVGELRRLGAIDATLNEYVLTARLGLLPHYDPLVRSASQLARVHAALARVPAFLPADARAELSSRVRELQRALAEKQGLLEDFKTENAVLRNSVRFFPIAAGDLADRAAARGGDGLDLAARVNDLRSGILLFTLVPERELLPRMQARIAALRDPTTRKASPEEADALELVLQHAAVVIERKPRVDALVDRIIALPTASRAAALDAAYGRNYLAAMDRAASYRTVLFLLALAALATGAGYIILRLTRSGRALADATARLRAANEALRREREKEKELSELKSRFVSMTSHEFRTPLSVILSSSELLEAYGERWGADKKRGHFARIQDATKSMTQMLDDILVFGRADAGMLAFAPAEIELGRFCEELVTDVAQGAGGSHPIALSTEGLAGDGRVVMDEKILRHILTNLLSNAMKYSPRGSPVHVAVRADGEARVFEVRDEGIGIPAEDLPHLFDSFHRGRNVGTIPGTGLGMAIVKRSVDLHRGTIDVDSKVGGGGTRFTVRLPAGIEVAGG